jgi:seryl-tRNA synthetase
LEYHIKTSDNNNNSKINLIKSSKMNKINKEHLTKIQEQQRKLNELIQQIGILESQKHGLLHELASVNKEVEEFKVELEDAYGQININVEDGTFKELDKIEELENV